MTVDELSQRALEIRTKFAAFEQEKWGREWTTQDLTMGFMGDLGDLVKLMQAKDGIRPAEDNIDEKIAHELSDCLWCIFVIANKYNIDISTVFTKAMDDLEQWIQVNGKNMPAHDKIEK
jgi:NTP pyrophosphatase (non-canonical NTP hydrolase)